MSAVRRCGLFLGAVLAAGCGGPPDLVLTQERVPPPDPPPEEVDWLRRQITKVDPLDRDGLRERGERVDRLMAAHLAECAGNPPALRRGLRFFQLLPSRPGLRDLAVAHLAHPDQGVRVSALLALETVGAEADLVPALPLLDPSTITAFHVPDAAAKVGGRRTAAALTTWLRAGAGRGGNGAAKKVVGVRDDLELRFPPPADPDRLAVALAQTAADDPKVRTAAVRTVADLGGPDDLGPAVALLDDEDATVREAARAALVKAGGDRARAALDVWLRVAEGRTLDPDRVEPVRGARDALAMRLKDAAPAKK